MRKAFDLGLVDAAAIRTAGGKIRLRLLFTADQLETMLLAARADEDTDNDMKHDETACNAGNDREEQSRIEDDEDDASERAPARDSVQPTPPTAPVGRIPQTFVRQGTPAWDAWVAIGHNPRLAVRREVKGRVRTGWDFPSLFPPKSTNETHQAE